MGGESCTVLRLRLMRKLAMPLKCSPCRYTETNKGRVYLDITRVYDGLDLTVSEKSKLG